MSAELIQKGLVNPEAVNNPIYRREMHQAIAERFGADHIVMFDDTIFAVPEHLRSELRSPLPAYERALMPATEATTCGIDTTLIVTAPPLPEEMSLAYSLYEGARIALEGSEQSVGNIQVIFAQKQPDGTFVFDDIWGMDEEHYESIVAEFAKNSPELSKVEPDEYSHIKAFEAYKEKATFGCGNVLVLPFQTVDEHHEAQRSWGERFVLPDTASEMRDKNSMYKVLSKMDTDGVRKSEIVPWNIPIEVAEDTDLCTHAHEIISAVDQMTHLKQGAFVKLDSEGASGLGMIPPNNSEFAFVYDQQMDFDERVEKLANLIESFRWDVLPNAVVEELVDIDHQEIFGEMEFTVGGFGIEGEFWPVCFDRCQQDGVYYISNFQSNNYEQLGITEQDAQEMHDAVAQATKMMHEAEVYSDGYIAFDIFKDRKDGKWKIHDPNLRRGGRTALRAMISMARHDERNPINETGIFNREMAFLVPDDIDQVEYLRKLVSKMQEDDPVVGVYGTAVAYFEVTKGNQRYVKTRMTFGLQKLIDRARELSTVNADSFTVDKIAVMIAEEATQSI